MDNPPRNGEVASRRDDGGVGRSPQASSPAESARPLHLPLRGRSPSPLRGGIILAALVLLADQLSKYWITGPLALPYREPIEILPIFRLIWVENYGVSMGFLTASSNGQRWLLVAMTGVIAVFIAVWLTRERKLPEALALGAILGGAIGNIADRARLGYVADFLNLHFGAWSPFYVFNVADVGVSLGVALLLIRSLFTGRGRPATGE